MSLTGVIERCRKSVEADRRGDLALVLRREVWRELGPRYEGGDRAASIGLQRRVRLARAAVEHEMPVWRSVLPDDSLPQQLLATSGTVMAGEMSERDAWTERGRAWTYLDDLAAHDEDIQISLAVGYGAAQVLACAIEDEVFGDASDEPASDDACDPEDLDAGFFGAAAHAGGPAWDEASNAARRREFWLWWLDTAGVIGA